MGGRDLVREREMRERAGGGSKRPVGPPKEREGRETQRGQGNKNTFPSSEAARE